MKKLLLIIIALFSVNALNASLAERLENNKSHIVKLKIEKLETAECFCDPNWDLK